MIASGAHLRSIGVAVFASALLFCASVSIAQIQPEYVIRQDRDGLRFSISLAEPQPVHDLRWRAPDGREMGHTQHITDTIRAESLEELKENVKGDWTLYVSGNGADIVYHFQVDLSRLSDDHFVHARLIRPADNSVSSNRQPEIQLTSGRRMGTGIPRIAKIGLTKLPQGAYRKLSEVDVSSLGMGFSIEKDLEPGEYVCSIDGDWLLPTLPFKSQLVKGPDANLHIASAVKCRYIFSTSNRFRITPSSDDSATTEASPAEFAAPTNATPPVAVPPQATEIQSTENPVRYVLLGVASALALGLVIAGLVCISARPKKV